MLPDYKPKGAETVPVLFEFHTSQAKDVSFVNLTSTYPEWEAILPPNRPFEVLEVAERLNDPLLGLSAQELLAWLAHWQLPEIAALAHARGWNGAQLSDALRAVPYAGAEDSVYA